MRFSDVRAFVAMCMILDSGELAIKFKKWDGTDDGYVGKHRSLFEHTPDPYSSCVGCRADYEYEMMNSLQPWEDVTWD